MAKPGACPPAPASGGGASVQEAGSVRALQGAFPPAPGLVAVGMAEAAVRRLSREPGASPAPLPAVRGPASLPGPHALRSGASLAPQLRGRGPSVRCRHTSWAGVAEGGAGGLAVPSLPGASVPTSLKWADLRGWWGDPETDQQHSASDRDIRVFVQSFIQSALPRARHGPHTLPQMPQDPTPCSVEEHDVLGVGSRAPADGRLSLQKVRSHLRTGRGSRICSTST